MPILHGISREHYAVHATQLFIDRSGVPHAHVESAPGIAHTRQKKHLLQIDCKCFSEWRVFMFWHDIVYKEVLYCVTNFELVWTCNKVAVVENAKKVSTVPHLPPFSNDLPLFLLDHCISVCV